MLTDGTESDALAVREQIAEVLAELGLRFSKEATLGLPETLDLPS